MNLCNDISLSSKSRRAVLNKRPPSGSQDSRVIKNFNYFFKPVAVR